MAMLGAYETLNTEQIRDAFNKAKETDADYLAIHGLSYGDDMMVHIYESSTAVRKDNQFRDLLKADVGDGLLNVRKVFDLSKSFEEASQNTDPSQLDQVSLDKAKREFQRRYDYREYMQLGFFQRLTTATPPKPEVLTV